MRKAEARLAIRRYSRRRRWEENQAIVGYAFVLFTVLYFGVHLLAWAMRNG